MKPGRKKGHDGYQIPHQFFFWRKGFVIHDRDIGSVTFTKELKPVIAEADKAVLVGDNQTADLPQFYLLNDLIETFSLVVERRSNIFHPLIHSDVMVLAVGAKCFSLGSKIFLLRHRRHASIRNHP